MNTTAVEALDRVGALGLEQPAARTGTGARLRRVAGRVVREPFVHFVLAGALLFAVSEYLEARANFSRVTITAAQVQSLITNYRLENGSAPTAQQVDALVDNLIKEEIFYHQALRLGLDKNDEIVRRRLVQKYEFLQQDLGVVSEPTEEKLRDFYYAHAANYTLPVRASFGQVYFSVDLHGEQAAQQRAAQLLATLNASGATAATGEGDTFPGPTDYSALNPLQVNRVFGESELSREIFRALPGHWVGPLRSGYGWHLVRVSEQLPPSLAPYSEVQDAVRRDYLDVERGRRNAEALAKLKRSFTIVREP